MRNLTKFLAALTLGAFTIIGCDEPIVEDTTLTPNGAALLERIDQHRESNTEHFSVDLFSTTGTTITSENGTIITFYYGNILDADGNIATGVIDVELLEIYDRSDMVLMNRSTMGVLPDGNHQALKTGGQFKLTATQGGEELQINGTLKVMVPVNNTGGADIDMTLFEAKDDDCDGIVCSENAWEEVPDSLGGQGGELALEDAVGVTYYACFLPDFGWSNIDRFMSNPAPKTMIKAKVPAEFDNTNCAVYVSFDDEENSLATLDVYLTGEGVFSEHYGQLPVGMNIHLIAVTVVEDQYYYSIKPATVTIGATIVLDDLVPTSEAGLVAAIESLP